MKQAMRNRVLEPYTAVQYFIPANDPMKDAGQEVPVRAGSLVIWNSALPHCNYPNRSNRFRMVQCVVVVVGVVDSPSPWSSSPSSKSSKSSKSSRRSELRAPPTHAPHPRAASLNEGTSR